MPYQNIKKGIIDNTFLITLLTVIAYICSFCFQYSFLHYFGLPNYFIEFDVMNIIFTLLMVFIAFGLYLLCMFPLISSFRKENRDKKIVLSYIIYYIPALFFLVILYDLDKSKSLNIFVGILFICLWTFQIILLKKKIKQNLEKDDSFLDKKYKRHGIIPIYICCISIIFIIGSYIAGKSIAQNQEEYLVFETQESSFAIIKPYNDSFLTIAFNREAKTFTRNIRILSEADISSKEIKISREHIGPLNNGSYYIEDNIFITFGRRFIDWISGRFNDLHKFPDLGNGYRINYDKENGLTILNPQDIYIIGHILNFDFDSKFIIADERSKDMIPECKGYISNTTLDQCNKAFKKSNLKNYLIIDKTNNTIYGPFDEKQYLKKRLELNIPSSVVILP